jgi:cell shape-determining protein MreC
MKKSLMGILILSIFLSADENVEVIEIPKVSMETRVENIEKTYKRIEDLNVSLSKRFTELKKVLLEIQKDFDNQECLEKEQSIDLITLELEDLDKLNKNYKVFEDAKKSLEVSFKKACKGN